MIENNNKISNGTKFSIVVPFYNESKNIPLVLEQFLPFASKYEFELICVNDGSKDDTMQVFDRILSSGQYPFVKFISYSPNGGYGNAIMTGVRAALGEVIAWTHSDLQTPVADVFKAYDVFTSSENKNIIVKGWRTNRNLQQIILSFGMATVASVILRRKLTEINAQPKLFGKSLVPLLKDAPKDFSLDLYMLCTAKNYGYKIKTIKVKFPERLHGESSWAFSWKSKFKTIWRSVKYIWRLRKEV